VRTWRLSAPGGSLKLCELPEPAVSGANVVVEIGASPLLSYLRPYVDGELPSYHPPSGPFTPGTYGVGRIVATGEEVFGLTVGERVFCSPHMVAAENVAQPPEALIALTAEGPSRPLLEHWCDGTLAERALMRARTLTPIPALLDDLHDSRLAALSRCVVPYGGLLRARLAPGDTVIIHGATGAFGSAAVLVALAMAAGRVIAAGRNSNILERLHELPRVHPVRMTGEIEADTRALREAAAGGADCALDMIGRADTAEGTRATLDALSNGGRLVLMGSMTVALPIDYAALLRSGRELIGNFMYPPTAPGQLLALTASGQLDLQRVPVQTYPLEELPVAMRAAEQPGAPLAVVTPSDPVAALRLT
jgi:alcohol dehydrogenase